MVIVLLEKQEYSNTFKLVSTIQHPGNFCPFFLSFGSKYVPVNVLQALHMAMLSRYQSYDNLYFYYTVFLRNNST